MADQRKYGAYPGFRGYAASTFDRLPRARKLEVMKNWFLGHNEDPANSVSYNSQEGGYLWAPGLGPNDANEEFQDQFGNIANFELIMEAVKAVQSGGTVYWASRDFFRRKIEEEALIEQNRKFQTGLPHALPYAFQAERPSAATALTTSSSFASGSYGAGTFGRGVFKPGVFDPGVFVEDEQQPDEPTARREMLDRLDRLEQIIAPLVAQVGMIGHNGPPGPIEDPALPEREPDFEKALLTARDILAVAHAISDIRNEAAAKTPDLAIVEARQGILARAGSYFLRLCDTAAQEGAKAFGE